MRYFDSRYHCNGKHFHQKQRIHLLHFLPAADCLRCEGTWRHKLYLPVGTFPYFLLSIRWRSRRVNWLYSKGHTAYVLALSCCETTRVIQPCCSEEILCQGELVNLKLMYLCSFWVSVWLGDKETIEVMCACIVGCVCWGWSGWLTPLECGAGSVCLSAVALFPLWTYSHTATVSGLQRGARPVASCWISGRTLGISGNRTPGTPGKILALGVSFFMRFSVKCIRLPFNVQ